MKFESVDPKRLTLFYHRSFLASELGMGLICSYSSTGFAGRIWHVATVTSTINFSRHPCHLFFFLSSHTCCCGTSGEEEDEEGEGAAITTFSTPEDNKDCVMVLNCC
jgi:hypothetical protein